MKKEKPTNTPKGTFEVKPDTLVVHYDYPGEQKFMCTFHDVRACECATIFDDNDPEAPWTIGRQNVDHCYKLEARGRALQYVHSRMALIPHNPKNPDYCCWYGDIARTILANL